MALPREKRTPKVDAIDAAIKKMSLQEFTALPGLERGDFEAFGTLIQHFCFIDLNLRRALEVFASSKKLPKKRRRALQRDTGTWPIQTSQRYSSKL
jgi:hypothetical protein